MRPLLAKGHIFPLPLLLVPLLAIFFWGGVFLGEIFWGQRDPIAFFLPTRFFYWENLRQGSLPLWSATMGSGFPIFAEGQTEMLNPVKLPLFLFLPFALAYNYSILLQYLLAGLFMWLYSRLLGLSYSSALATSIIFTFNGFIITHLVHTNMVSAIIWLPLLFYLIEKRFQAGKRGYLILAGTVLGVQILAGHPQMLAISTMAILSYMLFRGAMASGLIRGVFTTAVEFSLLVAIGAGLGAVQWLPTLELSSLSLRSTPLPRDFATYWSFPFHSFLTFFFPFFFGSDFSGDVFNGDYWGYRTTFQESAAYVGILPLILATAALVKGANKHAAFFGFLLLLSLFLALGQQLFLYPLLLLLPGFDRFSVPGRFLFLADFSLAILAGLGMEILLAHQPGFLTRLFKRAVVGLGLVFLASSALAAFYIYGFPPWETTRLFSKVISPSSVLVPLAFIGVSLFTVNMYCIGRISAGLFKFLGVTLIFMDLAFFGGPYNLTIAPDRILETPESAKFLAREEQPYRIFTEPLKKHYSIGRLFWPEDLVGNSGMLYNVNNADLYTPLYLRRYERLLSYLRVNEEMVFEGGRVASLLNIRYILSDNYISGDGLELVYDGGVRIYENRGALPRAFVVGEFKVIEEYHQALTYLASPDFYPLRAVLFEEHPEDVRVGSVAGPPGRAEIKDYSNYKVVIRASLQQPGFLVLTDAYYPGWEAYIEGRTTRIWMANYAFRAVWLPPGEHEVTFLFQPKSVYIGAIISLVASFFLLAVGIFHFVFKRDDDQGKGI